MMTFFLAMCTHPHVQTIAQAEIDAVTENNRLPSMEDRASLPYTDALLKEVLRWGPIAPLGRYFACSLILWRVTRVVGLAHRFDGKTDDIFNNYRIPKGSVVITNIWFLPILQAS
jgi:hypothetical protein